MLDNVRTDIARQKKLRYSAPRGVIDLREVKYIEDSYGAAPQEPHKVPRRFGIYAALPSAAA